MNHGLGLIKTKDKLESKKNGRETCARRFVVQSHNHQGQELSHTETILEAPAKELCVTSGDKNPRPLKCRGGSKQCLHIFTVFADGVAEKSKNGSAGSNPSPGFGDDGCGLLNRILRLTF